MSEIEPLRPAAERKDKSLPPRVPRPERVSPAAAPVRDSETPGRPSGLAEVLDAIRWRWPSALLVAGAITLGATLYVESLPAKYDAHAIVAFSPRPNVNGASSDTVRVLVPKYPSYVVAPATIDRVANSLGVDPSTAAGAIDATVKTDTGTMIVSARSEKPAQAANLANAFADDVVSFTRRDRLLEGQLVASAIPPTAPSAPHRRLLEAAALAVGLLGGIGFSVLLERGRPRLRSWRDMAGMTGYPVVGRVPPSRLLRTRPTEAFADPVIGAAFRTLRANLEPQLRDGSLDMLVVTSPTKADGKTVIASLLAESLARRGVKVLLIDADLHRSRLSLMLQANSRGLSAVLRGEARLQDVAEQGWVKGLWVIPTTIDSDAGDLLARRFEEVVREARERFDVLVIDSPPLLGTDDARTLASAAQGVLLVVSAGAQAGPVNESVLAIEALGAPLIGIVGNRVKESRNLYYY